MFSNWSLRGSRAVTSTDGMTADINRVVCDVTSNRRGRSSGRERKPLEVRCMIAGVIHICAIVLVSIAGILTASERLRYSSFYVAILAAGIIGGAAMMVSGFYLLDSWDALMGHQDFAKFDHTNPRRLPSGFYFLPSMTTALGAAAAFVFGWLLYGHVRQLW